LDVRPLLALVVLSSASLAIGEPALEMRFETPAAEWLEALPVGNGHLGAMVFGGVEHERLALNEDSIWVGHPEPRFSKGSPADLAAMRAALAEGDFAAADGLAVPRFSGGTIQRSYQPLGDLALDFGPLGEVEWYERFLDLDAGVAGVRFRTAAGEFERLVFASLPDDVIALVLRGPTIDFELSLTRPDEGGHKTAELRELGKGLVVMDGQASQKATPFENGVGPDSGVRFRAALAVVAEGGSVAFLGEHVVVHSGGEVLVLLSASTDFREAGWREAVVARVEAARGRGAATLLEAHTTEHAAAMGRVVLRLGPESDEPPLPLETRLAAVRAGDADPGFFALLFRYGRYLLLASSRPGSQPANLQGLWNPHLAAPWNADYHLNINLEMNYWPAEVANLAETTGPLFDFTERLAVNGRKRAHDAFGCAGWVAPHTSDLWASAWTRADTPYWGFWHNGAAWLLMHFMEHWRFGGDVDFLRERTWPLLVGAAEFELDWLVEDSETKLLLSGPSTSPENSFRLPEELGGQVASVCMAPAMDQQLVAALFDAVLEAAEALELESDPLAVRVRAARSKLAPGLVVGEDGRLEEWPYLPEGTGEVEPGHRHMSHLWSLFPGSAIDPVATPKLARAARAVIDFRLARGSAGTGWSRAWMVNFMARLGDGDAALEHLGLFAQRSLAANLFDLHPPFQIDGNFGVTSGIAELLLQSETGVIELLPALPEGWPEGSFRGLRARGGFEVAATWTGGELSGVELKSDLGRTATLRLGPGDWEVRVAGGDGALFATGRGTLVFRTRAEERYAVIRK
jgi:alpha-L-fucosidase 2